MTDGPLGRDWVAAFHAGTRAALHEFYREHYAAVDRSVGQLVQGADRETVVHEVFFRILSSEEMRRSFRGGSATAWITTVARNHAIDYRRRYGREVLDGESAWYAESGAAEPYEATDARLLVDRFRREVLPDKWRPVFEACFVQQLSQREAAKALGLSRTTLLYQQHRVRELLRRFLLEEDP